MNHNHGPDRRQLQLARLTAMLSEIEARAISAAHTAENFNEAAGLLTDVAAVAANHRRAIVDRHQEIFGDKVHEEPQPTITSQSASSHPLTASLEDMYGALSQVIVGYSMLGALANRFRDSRTVAKDGTTWHLTQRLLPEMVDASKHVGVMAHKALMWELECTHEDCRCDCAACGSGLCVCARTSMNALNKVLAGSPFFSEEGIYLYLPKAGSDAEGAGIKKGDVLVDVPGKEEGATLHQSLQATLKKDEPTVPLVFRRVTTGETEEIAYPAYKDFAQMRD